MHWNLCIFKISYFFKQQSYSSPYNMNRTEKVRDPSRADPTDCLHHYDFKFWLKRFYLEVRDFLFS